MQSPMKYIYIDTIAGFTEGGCYLVNGEWRNVAIAPLPNLAAIITRGTSLDTLMHKVVGVYTGLCEPRQPGTRNAWGHFPQLRQSKISIVAVSERSRIVPTLTELLAQGPQYMDSAYALEMGISDRV